MSVRLMSRRRFGTTLAAASLLLALGMAAPAFADPGFDRWVAAFRTTALKDGISAATYDRAFRNVTSPDPEVLEKMRSQPEFVAPMWEYFDNNVQDQSIANGRGMARKWKPWLDRIETRFGVDRNILLAIWSMETNYGEMLKNAKAMRNIVRSLATIVYAGGSRANFFSKQLIDALKILQHHDIDPDHFVGSWAGAMGHTQFIPTSYQKYAVDMDGDGRRDIWNSVPDALASAANLLHRNGWQTGKTWGYEVVLPEGRKFPAGSLSVDKWESIGVKRANGKAFPRGSDSAVLKVPDGSAGPAFLMLKNFSVIKRYNNADKYAIAVGLLADEIAGYGGLVHDWNRPFVKLTFEEREELQQRLSSHGYYDGKIDGRIGSASRAAIIAYQERSGLTQDGHPSKQVLTSLRGR